MDQRVMRHLQSRSFKRGSRAAYMLILLIGTLSGGYLPLQAQSQVSPIDLEVQINPHYVNAESISMIDLISSQRGSGPALFDIFLTNQDPQNRVENLYFSIRIISDRIGVMSDEQQIQGFPFGLDPSQRVMTDYYNVKHTMPEVEENIYFEGGLTAAGEELFNELGGSADLPPDRYSIVVELYQGGSRNSGGVLVASAAQELGLKISADSHMLYLIAPGGEPGADIMVNTLYPVFRWDGQVGSSYRLIVVEEERDESPESLIEGALSTGSPMQGTAGGLAQNNLPYEILDYHTDLPSVRFPSSGVQPLKPNTRYYWQVFSVIQGSRGVISTPSEMWSFRTAAADRLLQGNSQIALLLKELLGEERYQQLVRDGFSLESVQLEGEVREGSAALDLLLRVRNQLNEGSASAVIKDE